MNIDWAIVVPWHRDEEIGAFLEAWKIDSVPDWLVLQQDRELEGCGPTKNKGVRNAVERGADIVVVLDGDCYPADDGDLSSLALRHVEALSFQSVDLFEVVTDPPSRGTPYLNLTVAMPVAASMGFWIDVGDYCAARQLSHGAGPMTFRRKTIFGRYFPLCGMNVAFKPREWRPWCEFIDVPRFDDIWMGWLWQREAYRRGCCFNLAGPIVRHSRQSDVWKNLAAEVAYLQINDTLWREIATHPAPDYSSLRALLPVPEK